MIKIPFEKIISKIKEQADINEEELNSKIKEKMDQLSGLISKEGAAHIIANELGVKLFEEGKQKIKDILSGMRSVETIGKITNVFNLNEFQRKDGSPGKVASFVIGDETGRIRVVLWNDQAEMIKDLKPEITVKITNGYAKQNNNNSIELHLSGKSELIINPENETVGEVAQAQRQKAQRKTIESLSESDSNVELLATIVQIFDPRFYEVCPECNKRARPKDSSFVCDVHGEITPSYGFVINLILDDGTSTIRTVFFKNQLTNLLKLDQTEILKYKDNPAEFQSKKEELLGKMIKVVGRTTKNEMFDRLEFIAQLVFPDPEASEEIKKLEEEAKVIE
jgi:replication factor A1